MSATLTSDLTWEQHDPPTSVVDPLIVAMVSYDIYRNIHKGIRLEMFGVTTDAGRLDPDDTAACARFATRFRGLESLLVNHAKHEDDHLDAVIAEVMGAHAAEITESHVVLEERVEQIGWIVDAAIAATGVDRRAGFHTVYLELAAFTALYLQHQDDEERVVMRALDAAFPTETLAQLDAQIVASIAPDVLGACLAVMLPGMNVLDRCELLDEIRAHAPAEAFAGIWALAAQVLEPRDYLQVAHRMSLAVDGSVFE
ncbi:MAG: hypothetical protein JWM12_4187 [Ilumatobacteraceae bacterium]|nr:hypothetical protein [Ilumatobacteraceae bacterium]